MKLVKLTDDHYVVVDDSQIKEGDWYVHNQKGVGLRVQKCIGTNLPMDSKKITHSTQPLEEKQQAPTHTDNAVFINFNSQKVYDKIKPLSLQEVKELIGEVDVEKKAREEILYNDSKREWWKQGYNQALEDNKEKKYTEDDLLSAFNAGIDCEFGGAPSFDIWVKSIQPKTEWEVEWETIDNRQPCDCSCHKNPNMVHFVACCNDGWIGKVTQKLKLK